MGKLLIYAVIIVTFGCASTSQIPNKEIMLIKASALTKLSIAAESAVRYKGAPKDLKDHDLLQWATTHDSSLLKPFSIYTLKVLRQNQHAVVLLCSENGAIALLEDAGCTAEMDHHRWQDKPNTACEFSIRPEYTCGGT